MFFGFKHYYTATDVPLYDRFLQNMLNMSLMVLACKIKVTIQHNSPKHMYSVNHWARRAMQKNCGQLGHSRIWVTTYRKMQLSPHDILPIFFRNLYVNGRQSGKNPQHSNTTLCYYCLLCLSFQDPRDCKSLFCHKVWQQQQNPLFWLYPIA